MTEAVAIPATDPHLAARVRMVMVEPSHPGNIGAAARAMKNMGLQQLVLVNPRNYPGHPERLNEARYRAASAVDLVDNARIVPTLSEAIDDCQLVIGTSARSRRIPWPLVDARQAATRVLDESGQVALLFGREASGLTNDELARCQLHLHIATDPGYESLNIAMAMQLVAYELRQAWLDQSGGLPEQAWDRPWAESAAVEGMLEHLERTFNLVGFLDHRESGQVMMRMRRLFFRTRLDQVEVNILRGLLTRVEQVAAGSGAGNRKPPEPS